MSDAKPIEPVTVPDPSVQPPAPIQPPAADGGIRGIDGGGLAPGRALANQDAGRWFLPPAKGTHRMDALPATREVYYAQPLIEGATIFTELEMTIASAKSSVLLAYWAIEVNTRLLTDPKKTWTHLLVEAAQRGVKVRVLMNDFDPGLRAREHTSAWLALGQLLAAADKVGVPTDLFQAVVIRHPVQVPPLAMMVAARNLYDDRATLLNLEIPDPKRRAATYLYSPGLWDKIRVDKDGKTVPVKAGQAYPGWPASHHQKIAIIDGRVAFTGGVNLTDTYIDTEKHPKPKDKEGIGPWHDAYVRVEGPDIVRDFVANFIGLWNLGKASMEAFLKTQAAALTLKKPWYLGAAPTELKEADIAIDTSAPGTKPPAIPAQIHRTWSDPVANAPFFTPVREDVLQGYKEAIKQANDYIYIENQYFRDARIGTAIIDRWKRHKQLQVIVLVPSRSEEEIRNKADPVTLYGAALQHEAIKAMTDAMGGNVGVFAMERKDGAVIYVHSKLMLIDDRYARIGSANTNPRSLSLDTELDLAWYDPDSVRALRLRLWEEILGKAAKPGGWKPADYVKQWKKIAEANAKAAPARLQGFVRPYKNAEFKRGLVDLGPYS